MDNPDTETTTVNVKGMPVSAWKLAREAAGRTDETLGEWLSRAIRQLAEAERSGPRVIPPATPAEPRQAVDLEAVAAAATGLGEMMKGMAALAQASGVMPAERTVRGVYAAAARIGRPPRAPQAANKPANLRAGIGYPARGPAIEAPPG